MQASGPCSRSRSWFFSLSSGGKTLRFSHRTVRLSQKAGKKLLCARDSHIMIHSVPYYRQQP